jgi:hypothetical protein
MATARTPSSLIQESVGSMTLWIAPFTVIDDTDTYASGQTNRIVAAWCDPTDVPTGAAKEGIDVTYTLSTGAITFNVGEDARAGNLYMLTSGDGLNS